MQSRDYEKELIIHASEPEFDKVYNRVKGFLQFETKLTKLKLDLTEHKIRKILKNFEKDPRFWEFFTLSQKVLNIKEIDIAKLKKETFDLKDANSFLENENSQLKQKIDSLMQSSSKMEHSLNSEIIKLNAKLESSNSGIADLEKALKSSKKEKNKKIQESFSKVLEKDQIIAKLNSDILLKDQLLKERELKISELQLNIRKILNFQNDASQPLVTQLIEHKMESPENEISKYFDVQDDNRLHHIFSCRNIRHRILSFLDLQSILKLKSSSFMIYKFISLDSKSIEFIVRSIEDSYKKRIGILNNSLNYFYKRINSSSDDYISFVLHKHLTLKYGFMDSIQSSIMNSAGIIYKIKKEYEAQEEIKIDEDLRIIDQAKSQGNDLHQQEKPDLESQLDPKIDIAKVQTRAPVKKDSLGFISTLAGTSVKDYTSFFGKMINEENEFGRNEKQLSDFYDQHLELFKRVGIMYSKGENFEERMSNRKVQQETFEDTIVKSAVALLHSLQNYTKEESYNNFILPFCRVSIFSSLFLQEEIQSVLDYMASIYVEEVKRSELLMTDIQDLSEKVLAMGKVKSYYINKVQDFEARASTLELTILEKERELNRSNEREQKLNEEVREFKKSLISLKTMLNNSVSEIQRLTKSNDTLEKNNKHLISAVGANFVLINNLKI